MMLFEWIVGHLTSLAFEGGVTPPLQSAVEGAMQQRLKQVLRLPLCFPLLRAQMSKLLDNASEF